MIEDIFRLGDPVVQSKFVRSFFADPDQKIDDLRRITCPSLIIVGELDELLIEPCKIMANEIPNAQLALLEGVGHMTAIESPERMTDAVLRFLESN